MPIPRVQRGSPMSVIPGESASAGPLLTIQYGHTVMGVATPSIKSTYSLDPQTVRDLERLARKYGPSKSDVLRRAVRSLAAQEGAPAADALLALDELQLRIGLSKAKADAWAEEIRSERAELGRDRGQ